MANINKELNDIKNAVYGREVRGSIHDGIKKINEEVENTTDRQDSVEAQFQSVLDETTGKDVISAPEITAARVGADDTNYPNLKERLDTEYQKLSSQLAQTADDIEALDFKANNIQDIATNADNNAQEAKTKAVSAENTANSVQSQFDQIVTNVAEGVSEEEILASRVASDNQAKPSLNARLTFDYNRLDDKKLDAIRHIFNAAYIGRPGRFHIDFENRKILTRTGGTFFLNGVARPFNATKEFEFPDEGYAFLVFDTETRNIIFTTYTEAVNLDKSRYGVFGTIWGTYESYFVNGSGVTTNLDVTRDMVDRKLDSRQHIFNASYVGRPGRLHFDFENRKVITRTGGTILFNGVSRSLIDKEFDFPETGYAFLVFDSETRDILFTSYTEALELDKTRYGVFGNFWGTYESYFVNGSGATSNLDDSVGSGWVRGSLTGHANSFDVDFDSQKIITRGGVNYVSVGSKRYSIPAGEWSFLEETVNILIVMFDTENQEILFFPSASVGSNPNYIFLGVIAKVDQTCDFDGVYSVNGSPVIPFTKRINDGVSGGGFTDEIIITDDLNTEYVPNPNQAYVDHSPEIPYTNVYDIYDDLVDRFPNYVEREFLGNDRDENPLYSYTFTPPTPQEINNHHNHKTHHVYYQNCIHGHEKPAAIGAALFFKDLCENWTEQAFLRALRFNVKFTVVPVVNPSGFNLNQRKNSNGVDLNRNFPTNWTYNPDPEDRHYGGEAPLSEPETQYIQQIIESNPDITVAIDNHTFGVGGPYVIWLGAIQDKTRRVLGGFGSQIDGWIKQNYPQYYPEVDEAKSKVASVAGGSASRHFGMSIPGSILLETPLRLASGATDEETQKVNMYMIGNAIRIMLKNRQFYK